MDSGDGCRTARNILNVRNHTLKMVNFVTHILPQFLKNGYVESVKL